MTAVYLFAGLLLLLVVVGLVVSPLLEGEPMDEADASPDERRDAEIETLREVEFEYRTGKLSEEDYRELRSRHAEAAVRARRQAEEGAAGDGGSAEGAGEQPAGAGEDPIDAATETKGAAKADGAGEAPPAERIARRCPECGAEARTGARFCSRCGSRLEDEGG